MRPPKPIEAEAFHLASSFALIPAKRIHKIEFVHLRELLPDYLALSEKLEALSVHITHELNLEYREITRLVVCMATYVDIAIAAQAHPQQVWDMLAYMHLMVRKGYKYGGAGWLKYNAIF